MIALNVVKLGKVRDREVLGLSWEDKEQILRQVALYADQRVQCNVPFVIVRDVEGKCEEGERKK